MSYWFDLIKNSLQGAATKNRLLYLMKTLLEYGSLYKGSHKEVFLESSLEETLILNDNFIFQITLE